MAGNRQAAEKVLLKLIDDMDPKGVNGKIYREELLPSMADKQFDKWMDDIESGKQFLPLYYPNMTKSGITTKNNIAVAEKWGIKLFQRIYVTDNKTGQRVLTPKEIPVLHFPVRRLAQTLEKKMATAEDNIHLDELTDQVTGVSKASAISNPEIIILEAMGFKDMLLEFMKYRGGDQKGYRLMERSIAETGKVTTEALDPYSGKNKAVLSTSRFLTASHLGNNLAK